MTCDDETRRNILAELIAAETMPPREPDEMTLQEIAAQAGVSESTAKYRLSKLEMAGRATSRMVQGDYHGRATRVWRIIT